MSDHRGLWWAISDLEDEPVDGRSVVEADYSEENGDGSTGCSTTMEYNLPLSERPECHQDGTTYNAV